jgi:hypothetical protein
MRVKEKNFKVRYEKIKESKAEISFSDLFEGFPLEFSRYM